MAVAFVSCKPEKEKLTEDIAGAIHTYYSKTYKQDSIIIDSVKIYKLDTLTEKKDSLRAYFRLSDDIEILQTGLHKQVKVVEAALKLSQASAKISEELYNEDRDIALAEMKKLDEATEEYKRSFAHLTKLINLIDGKTLDSTRFKGYIARFNIKAHDNLNVSKNVDSISLAIDLAKYIIEHE